MRGIVLSPPLSRRSRARGKAGNTGPWLRAWPIPGSGHGVMKTLLSRCEDLADISVPGVVLVSGVAGPRNDRALHGEVKQGGHRPPTIAWARWAMPIPPEPET